VRGDRCVDTELSVADGKQTAIVALLIGYAVMEGVDFSLVLFLKFEVAGCPVQ